MSKKASGFGDEDAVADYSALCNSEGVLDYKPADLLNLHILSDVIRWSLKTLQLILNARLV